MKTQAYDGWQLPNATEVYTMMTNAFFGLGVGVEIKDHIIGRYLIQDTLNSSDSIAELAMIISYLKDQYSYVGFFYGYQMYSRVSIRIYSDQFDTVYLG